jgi:Cdc6-like AAA superfamily ATPase
MPTCNYTPLKIKIKHQKQFMTYQNQFNPFRDSLCKKDRESFDLDLDLTKIQIKTADDRIVTKIIDPMQSYFLKGETGRGKTAIALQLAKQWLREFKKYQNQKYQNYLDLVQIQKCVLGILSQQSLVSVKQDGLLC